jgi:hypothetical protein
MRSATSSTEPLQQLHSSLLALQHHRPMFPSYITAVRRPSPGIFTVFVIFHGPIQHQHAMQSTKHHPGVIAATEWGKRYGEN